MLWNLCTIMFLTSGALEGLKEYTFRKRLERDGYEINDNRSITEKVISYIKEYFHVLIPVYNVFKSGKKLFSDEDAYYTNRFNKLNKKGIIKEISKKEEVKETPKKEVQEEKKTVTKTNKPSLNNTKSENKGYTLEEMNNIRNYYAKQDKELRARYKLLKSKGASVQELNQLVATIKEVDKKFYEMDEAILRSKSNSVTRVKKQ